MPRPPHPPSAAPEIATATKRRQYRRRRDAGECTRCGGSPRPGLTLCERCWRRQKEATTLRRHRRLRIGLCPWCAAVNRSGKAACDECLRRKAAWTKAWEARQAAATRSGSDKGELR